MHRSQKLLIAGQHLIIENRSAQIGPRQVQRRRAQIAQHHDCQRRLVRPEIGQHPQKNGLLVHAFRTDLPLLIGINHAAFGAAFLSLLHVQILLRYLLSLF